MSGERAAFTEVMNIEEQKRERLENSSCTRIPGKYTFGHLILGRNISWKLLEVGVKSAIMSYNWLLHGLHVSGQSNGCRFK